MNDPKEKNKKIQVSAEKVLELSLCEQQLAVDYLTVGVVLSNNIIYCPKGLRDKCKAEGRSTYGSASCVRYINEVLDAIVVTPKTPVMSE